MYLERKNIAVAGAGYVGLSLAVFLARRHHVCIVDVVSEKVDMLRRGESPFENRDLKNALTSGTLDLSATTDPVEGYRTADYVIVAVSTNYDDEKHSFDTSAVEMVHRQVRAVNQNAVLVIRSTVPVGYTRELREKTGDRRILFSPEFLRESSALYDNLHPSRIIVGTKLSDEQMAAAAEDFARLLREGARKENVETRIIGTTEAEAVKLFSNTYLALRVSFFNELDTYAEVNGLDSRTIIEGICLDPRVGNGYNNPSFGYGGYCLPKDTKQLLASYGPVPQHLMKAVVESNRTRKEHIVASVMEQVRGVDRPVIGVYRLTMKQGSDNFRESAVLDMIDSLRKKGAEVLIYEPLLKEALPGCRMERDLTRFSTQSDMIIANRLDRQLAQVREKVYTRDVFGRD